MFSLLFPALLLFESESTSGVQTRIRLKKIEIDIDDEENN